MASYLQIENISKSYGPKVLFEKIGFNINEGDKIALIAPNGTGKTSLMRILACKDKSDSGGKIMFLKDIKIAFLEQEYPFDPEKGIFDQIMSSSTEFTTGLDQEHLWEYERRVVKFLTNFNLPDPDQKMKELSGGERETTNNRMELTAVIKGLEALKEPCRVTVVTDSKYGRRFTGTAIRTGLPPRLYSLYTLYANVATSSSLILQSYFRQSSFNWAICKYP